ncbi:gamma-glutamylcyclotransferase family protein [Terasakiella pusilla]|uniref:gamma-glutamylcyclotransferase family protein n=1 Tax=Terasakiella pusilla TaxID=64973 RepID=UPI003AA906FB
MDQLQRDIKRCPRVAVYGTLKQGCHNHYWLEGAERIGCDRLTTITLYDLGPYPGAKAEASAGAVVEIYAINAEQLDLLDQLEGYFAHAPRQGLYNRVIFSTQHGEAWCYLFNAEVNERKQIDNGKW